MGYAWDILAPANITRIIRQTQDILTLPMPLLWYERAAKPNVSDAELTLRDRSFIYAADIISSDAKALIRDAGDFKFEQHQIVKLKHGFGISESQAQLIRRIEKNLAMDNEILTFEGYIARHAKDLLTGIEQRSEALLVAMLNDGVTYNRLGIQISGTWNMPSDLKFNPATAWSTAGSATPIADLTNCLQYAQRHYGEAYDRITMSYKALQQIVATTEFKDVYKANAFKWGAVADNAVASHGANPGFYIGFLANFIAAGTSTVSNGASHPVVIEIYQGQYREYAADGSVPLPTPFQPDNVVFFSNSADDGQSSGWDWGNGEVMEAVLGKMGGTGIIGSFTNEAFGPIGYTTQADMALNPAGLVLWAVSRGAPRKHRDTCTAKLTVV